MLGIVGKDEYRVKGEKCYRHLKFHVIEAQVNALCLGIAKIWKSSVFTMVRYTSVLHGTLLLISVPFEFCPHLIQVQY